MKALIALIVQATVLVGNLFGALNGTKSELDTALAEIRDLHALVEELTAKLGGAGLASDAEEIQRKLDDAKARAEAAERKAAELQSFVDSALEAGEALGKAVSEASAVPLNVGPGFTIAETPAEVVEDEGAGTGTETGDKKPEDEGNAGGELTDEQKAAAAAAEAEAAKQKEGGTGEG